MRQAGSSFAIATRITVRVIEGLPPATPTDGGDFFALDGLSREAMLGMVERAAHGSGLLNYIHINGVDFLVVAASTDWHQNVAWLQRRLGRKLSAREWLRNSFVDAVKGPVSSRAGGDARFGSSGAVPYVFSTQEAFATVSFIMPLACYVQPHMRALLAALPARRDPRTDLGCYFQVRTGDSLKNSNFGAFGEPMARATWAWRPLRGSLRVLQSPYCHHLITQRHRKGDRGISEKVKSVKVFT